MKRTTVAIYTSMEMAQNAKEQLLTNGFDSENIDVSSGKTHAQNSYEEESGISRFFKNLFGNNDDAARRYASVSEEGYVVTVCSNSHAEAQGAAKLLDDLGAIDVDDSYDERANRREFYDDGKERSNDFNENAKVIPVIEETIRVGKKEVAIGGVRIRSRIFEKPIEENLRLREEHIRVERNKVDRLATEEDLKNYCE